MFKKLTHLFSFTLTVAATLASFQFFIYPAAIAGEFEDPPQLSGLDLVDPDLLIGPYHRVEDEVENDGMMNHFQIRSDFGDFEAPTEEMLEIRVREVYALERLEELSRTKVFAQALGRSAKKSAKTVAQVVSAPVETAKAIPKGLGRKFRGLFYKGRKLGHKAKEEADDIQDSSSDPGDAEPNGSSTNDHQLRDELAEDSKGAAKSHFGYNSARRELAQKLQIDPYTTNPPLRAELTRLAKAAFAGGLSFKAVTPGLALVSQVQSVSDLVYSTPSNELERLNNIALKKMGVKSAVRLDYFEKGIFTPTLDTALVDSLKQLDPAQDRARMIDFCLLAQSEVDARAIVRQSTILATYNKNEAPLRRLLLLGDEEQGLLVVGVTKKGKLIVPVPADYLTWSPGIEVRGALYDYRKREMHIAGRISPRAERELAQRGWNIATQVLSKR